MTPRLPDGFAAIIGSSELVALFDLGLTTRSYFRSARTRQLVRIAIERRAINRAAVKHGLSASAVRR